MSQRILLSFSKPDIPQSALTKTRIARGSSLFAGLTEGEKDMLLKDARPSVYKRRELLFKHGDPLMKFYLVCGGIVQLYRSTPDGREITTDIITTGDTLCAKEIIEARNTHHMSAIAVNDVEVMELPPEWLRESAQKCSRFSLNLLSAISRQATLTEVKAEHRTTMSAAQIVGCYLQHVVIMHNLNPKSFDLPVSKSLIASRLGMELETLSRTLPKLKQHGITVRGKNISFDDMPKLENLACSQCAFSDSCQAYKALHGKNHK